MTAWAMLAAGWAAAALLLFAAAHDLCFRTVPDWASACLAAAGCAIRAGEDSLAGGLACGAAVFALAALCWRRRWLGGGDVKLLAAGALLVRPGLVPGYLAAVALCGGALALAYLLLERAIPRSGPGRPTARRSPRTLAPRLLAIEARRIRRRLSLPYAAAIGAGALLTLADG